MRECATISQRSRADQIVETKTRNAVDLVETRAQFVRAAVVHARFEVRDDAVPVIAAHGENERKTELLTIRRVQAQQLVELFLRALTEARAALLARRFSRQFATHGRLARELRVSVDERELLRL